MSDPLILDLDALADTVGVVRLGGQDVPVRAADAVVYRAVLAINAAGDHVDVVGMYDVVARVLPSLPREAIDALTLAQVAAVLARSVGGVARVEGKYPNSDRPATEATESASPPA